MKRKATQTRFFAPSGNSECLCGSEKKFKRCCVSNLPGFDIREKTKAAMKAGDYQTALIAARSDVTQCYKILNRTDEFSAVLERLRSNIDHPRWQRKIVSLHAYKPLEKSGIVKLEKRTKKARFSGRGNGC